MTIAGAITASPQPARPESVAIVGAGPTGVMLAIELARRGVAVRVLDRLGATPAESRATGIHARTLEIFHQLGIVDEFLALGQRLDGFALHTHRRRPIRVRWDGLDTPYPFLLNLPQNTTQRILDHTLEQLGVTITRSAEVLDLAQTPEGVELTVTRSGREQAETLTADWVVGCDGAHSIVRRRLGLAFDGDDYGQDWLMADVHLDPAPSRDHFHFYIHTPVPFVALPLPSGRFRVFLPQVPNRGVAERTRPDLAEIRRLTRQRGPAGLTLSDPDLLAAFRCYRRTTSTMRHGRVLVAGDAAHIHSPAGGQGLNTGLQDAFNLGWKLALVAQHRAPAALLDTYEEERLPVARGVLALSHAMVSTLNVPSAARRRVRDRALPVAAGAPIVRRRFTARVAGLSLNYRGARLSQPQAGSRHGRLAAGDRLPAVDCRMADGRTVSILELLGTEHTLLVLAGSTAATAPAVQALVTRFARFGDLVRVVAIAPPALGPDPAAVTDSGLRVHRRYGARAGRLLLVRPDGYLAASAALDQPDLIERHLLVLTSDAVAAAAGLKPGPTPAPAAGHPIGATATATVAEVFRP